MTTTTTRTTATIANETTIATTKITETARTGTTRVITAKSTVFQIIVAVQKRLRFIFVRGD